MTKEEIKIFNKVSRELCDKLKSEDKCECCPFYQWDTYYNCFDEDGYDYPLNEIEEGE